jgi:hypothetical protein
MDTCRKTAVFTGVLYIVATVAGVLSVVVLGSLLDSTNYLMDLSANETKVMAGALLELTMALAVVGIAFTMYPLLRKVNETGALWYLGTRFIESILFIVSVIALLSLLTLSREFVDAAAHDVSYFQTIGTVLMEARETAAEVFSNIVGFGISTLFFYYLLYQSKLVPRWLSVWGLIGAPLYIAAGFVVFFVEDPDQNILTLLYLPIAVNEMVLALWLIIKGFNKSAIASLSA